jgi:hypothetical protein
MSKKAFYAVLAAALCLAVPAAVRALYQNDAKALYCEDNANPICGLYQVCRPILDKYPESEITEKGKDCTLTIESRQIIIRRKRVDEEAGYFFYVNWTAETKGAP